MQDVSYNNLMFSSSWYPKAQSYITMPDGLSLSPARKVTNLPLFSLDILRAPFEPLLISANVRGGGTV
jgi:hypothetical protein